MAADWIKLRCELQTHPKVVRILSATQSDKFRAIGGLHAVWSIFDTHSVDGALVGYTPAALDHIIGWQGFSEAMMAVKWLAWDGAETLTLPEFDEHNGQSAKRRAEDQKRKRNARSCPQSVRNLSADEVEENRTREREEKEEKQKHSSSGDDAKVAALDARLTEVARDAVETWNASELVAGGLASIRIKVGFANRKAQVRRMLQTAREICLAETGTQTVTRQFWVTLWELYAQDDFYAGRGQTGRGHDNWKPDFEFLTRPATVLKLYDKTTETANAQ